MSDFCFSRREWLKTTALATTPLLLGPLPAVADAAAPGKTPPLSGADLCYLKRPAPHE